MPVGLSKEEADALRARVKAFVENEPKRSPKRRAIQKAIGKSNFGSFLRGARGLSRDSAAKAEVVFAGGQPAPAPTPRKTGPTEKLPDREANELRAEIKRRFPRLADFIMRAMGIAEKSSSHWYHQINGRLPISVESAARMRAALNGSPPVAAAATTGPGLREIIPRVEADALRAQIRAFLRAQSMARTTFGRLVGANYNSFGPAIRGQRPITVRLAQRLRAAMGAPSPTSLVHVPAAKKMRQPRASRDVLTKLRLDLGHVLATKYGGQLPQLAHAVGLTAARLSRFLDGGALTLEESRDVSSALAGLEPRPLHLVTRAVAMGRAGHGFANRDDLQPEPPELRARKLVAKWGHEAIEIVLQLANLGAA